MPCIEAVALLTFSALWLALLWQAGVAHGSGLLLAWALLMLPAGLLTADFASGVVHWVADHYFDETTPILGPALIQPFREHHVDPGAIARHGALEVNGNTALVAAPVLGFVLWAQSLGMLGAAWAVFTLVTSLALLGTNQVHKWAHQERSASFVRWLQRHALLLPPERHAQHHAPPHRGSYCITGGWLNPWLDRWDFFARLDARLHARSRRRV